METVSRWKRLKIHQNTIHRYIKEYTSTSFTKERAELSPICCLLYSELFISGPNLFPWRRNQDKNVPILDIWLILVIMTQGSLRLHLVEDCDLSIIPWAPLLWFSSSTSDLGEWRVKKKKSWATFVFKTCEEVSVLENWKGVRYLKTLPRAQRTRELSAFVYQVQQNINILYFKLWTNNFNLSQSSNEVNVKLLPSRHSLILQCFDTKFNISNTFNNINQICKTLPSYWVTCLKRKCSAEIIFSPKSSFVWKLLREREREIINECCSF